MPPFSWWSRRSKSWREIRNWWSLCSCRAILPKLPKLYIIVKKTNLLHTLRKGWCHKQMNHKCQKLKRYKSEARVYHTSLHEWLLWASLCDLKQKQKNVKDMKFNCTRMLTGDIMKNSSIYCYRCIIFNHYRQFLPCIKNIALEF